MRASSVAPASRSRPYEQVCRALTDPAQVLQWWGQNGVYRCAGWEIDLRPGGKWVTRGVGADGKPFRVAGEYLEVNPPRALEYTWTASWSGDLKTTVRWKLEAGDGWARKRIAIG
jgi:uncharacterized protein YndB with AHSA1/START domain